MANDPSISIIRGLQANVASDGVTISVSPGICYLPDTRRCTSDGTATIVLTGATPSTFYHLYAYIGVGNVLALEVSTTAPAAPYQGSARVKTGDATRRYLISGRTNASGVLRPGKHTRPTDMGNVVMLSVASAAGGLPISLLSGLNVTTVQTVDLSAILPLTANRSIIQVINASTFTVYVVEVGGGNPSPTNYQWAIQPNSGGEINVGLDSNKRFLCLLSATTILGALIALLLGSVNINLIGYEFDR